MAPLTGVRVLEFVQRVLLSRAGREWEECLGRAGVACGIVNDIGGALGRGQVSPAPLLGEHTDAVLGEIGYSLNAVMELRTAGAVR